MNMSTPGTRPDAESNVYLPPSDDRLLKMLARNIANLKREIELGTRVDPASISDLEDEYRKLSAALNQNATPRHRQGTD